jgi:amino acid transporter
MTEPVVPNRKGGSEARLVGARSLGLAGVLVFTASGMGLGFSGWYYFAAIPGAFPGSSLGTILLVALAGMVLLSAAYAVIGTLAPYYGADYRFTTRVLSAPLGFASSFAFVVLLSLASGAIISSIFTSTVPGLVKTLATIIYEKNLFNQAQAVSAPYAVTLSGTSLLLLVFLLLILPQKVTHRVLLVGAALSLIAWVFLFAQLGSAAPASFPAAWDRFSGAGSFFEHLAQARQLGMVLHQGASGVVSAGMLFAIVLFSGFLGSVNISAEIKEPRKNLLPGGMIAAAAGVAVLFGAVFFLGRLAPAEWLSAESYLAQVRESSVEAKPWIAFYGAVVMPNPGIAWLQGGLWMISILNLAHAFLYTCSRVFSTWVEDGVFPERLGFIHPGSKSPLLSVLSVCVLAELGLVTTAVYQNIFTPAVLIPVIAGVLACPLLAVSLLPFRKKALFNSAPGWMKLHFGPLPLVSLIGALSLLYLFGATAVLTKNQLGIPLMPVLAGLGIVFFAGLVWYYGRRSSLLARGVDLDQVFRDLPE